MKTFKKSLVLALAGVMVLAALALTGCFGFGGSGSGSGSSSGGSSGGSSTTSPMVGTWKLAEAYDYWGSAYDVSDLADKVVLVVESETKATFYYFDDDPYPGTLVRDSSIDDAYAADGFTAKGYDLQGSDNSYWELAFITSNSDGTSFWYLEVGSTAPDCLYLTK